MTDIYKTQDKKERGRFLRDSALRVLKENGWTYQKLPGHKRIFLGKKENQEVKFCLKHSQDAWLAFVPKRESGDWVTLDEIDFVLIASVNEKENPTSARVHFMPAPDVLQHFDKALAERKRTGKSIQYDNRGEWISLYDEDNGVGHLVGAGLGLKYPPLAEVPLPKEPDEPQEADPIGESASRELRDAATQANVVQTAKEDIASFFGIKPEAVTITVNM